MDKCAILEGLLFVVGDEGLTLKDICNILEIEKEEAKKLLMELKKDYDNEKRGIRISFLGDSFKLTTKKEHKNYYQKLLSVPRTNTLSIPALETLAIIAYNQPITRVEIDDLRGVASANIVRKLVAKGLIKEAGKSNMPGRPNLYKTTHDFLDYFGLSTIDDLPEFLNNDESTENEKELFTSIYKEE